MPQGKVHCNYLVFLCARDVVDIEKVVSFVRSLVLFCREEKSSQCQCQPTATGCVVYGWEQDRGGDGGRRLSAREVKGEEVSFISSSNQNFFFSRNLKTLFFLCGSVLLHKTERLKTQEVYK